MRTCGHIDAVAATVALALTGCGRVTEDSGATAGQGFDSNEVLAEFRDNPSIFTTDR